MGLAGGITIPPLKNTMKKLIMYKGLPACGKTKAAKALLKVFGSGNAKRINKDDLRAMLDDGQWSKGNEQFVLETRNFLVRKALASGLHAIVDDTNLAPKHEEALRKLAQAEGAEFEVKDMTDVPLETCVKRDLYRANSVGGAVIIDMWERYLKPKDPEPPKWDAKLPNAIICDVDGTVAEMHNRGPFDWSLVQQDTPRHVVLGVLESMYRSSYDIKVLFVSGRDSVCREGTEWWLNHFWGHGFELFMRPQGDKRKDSIVKREIYDQHIAGKYNVVAIFDDRPQVIRMWQSLGFKDRIFNVGDGTEF